MTGPIEGMLWLANKIDEQAEQEFYNEPAIRGKLMELELRYDMGEISEEEFMAVEEELLARLKIIRERRAAS